METCSHVWFGRGQGSGRDSYYYGRAEKLKYLIPCPPFCGNRAKSGRYLVNFIFLYCRKASKPPLTSKIGFSGFQLDGIHP